MADIYSFTILKMTICNLNGLEPDSCIKLTVLMEVNEVQREVSTLSHTPEELQVLLIMVVVVGQRRVWVVPARVKFQKKNSVVSASHPRAACVCIIRLRRDRRVYSCVTVLNVENSAMHSLESHEMDK